VENLSQNVVVVGGALVAKGRAATILEGGKIGFVAKSDGSAETKFLELMLRRAKVGGDASTPPYGPERGSFDQRRRSVEEELMLRRAKVGGDASTPAYGPERGSFDQRRRSVEEESPAEHMRHMSQRPSRPIS